MKNDDQNVSASTTTPSSLSDIRTDLDHPDDSEETLTFAPRGEQVNEETVAKDVDGFDAERMRARSLLTAAEEKALLRKIDWRLMTVCSILFLIKNIDADNISNARIMNKGTDRNIMKQLGMTSDEYNLLTVCYYVSHLNYLEVNFTMINQYDKIPYIVFEAPSNLLIKRFSPSTWQSRIVITWGIAVLCHVPVVNKGGIYGVRFLLGMVS